MESEIVELPLTKEDSLFTIIELFEEDKGISNVYYTLSDLNQPKFLIKTTRKRIRQEIRDKILKVNKLNIETFLKFCTLYEPDELCVYLIYEFSDISLDDYIKFSKPSFIKRLNLIKQFVQSIIIMSNNHIRLDQFNPQLIFIENLQDPQLKILYTSGMIEFQNSERGNTRNEEEDCSDLSCFTFDWMIKMFCIIFSIDEEKSENDAGNENGLFEDYNDESKEILVSLYTNTKDKLKKRTRFNFTLENYVELLNKLLSLNELDIIKNKITTLIGDSIEEMKPTDKKSKMIFKLEKKSKSSRKKSKESKQNVTIVNIIEQTNNISTIQSCDSVLSYANPQRVQLNSDISIQPSYQNMNISNYHNNMGILGQLHNQQEVAIIRDQWSSYNNNQINNSFSPYCSNYQVRSGISFPPQNQQLYFSNNNYYPQDYVNNCYFNNLLNQNYLTNTYQSNLFPLNGSTTSINNFSNLSLNNYNIMNQFNCAQFLNQKRERK